MRIVLEEALRAGVQRVVLHLLGGRDRPRAAGQTADEASVWDGGRYGIPYLDAKHEAETAALRLVARGLPLVIVNPAHVLGPGRSRRRSSTTLVRRFMRRQIPAYVDGTLNIVGVQDVARGHLLADERGAVGERYILGNRNFTMRPAVRRPGAAVGRRAAGAQAAAARWRWRWPRPASGSRAGVAHPGRGPGGLAELGVHQPQGQARARLDDLAARGLPGGDGRLVPRARRTSGWRRRARASRSRCALAGGRCVAARLAGS